MDKNNIKRVLNRFRHFIKFSLIIEIIWFNKISLTMEKKKKNKDIYIYIRYFEDMNIVIISNIFILIIESFK